MASSPVVIQLHFGRSQNKALPNIYCGGQPSLADNEATPACETCESKMTLLCQLDHSAFPLAGLMKSKGLSRVFICHSNECPSFGSFQRIDSTVLQSDYPSSAYAITNFKDETDLERFNLSPVILSVESPPIDNSISYIESNMTNTKIVLQIHNLFDIKFISAKGNKLRLKTVELEDTLNGLRMVGVRMGRYEESKQENNKILRNENTISFPKEKIEVRATETSVVFAISAPNSLRTRPMKKLNNTSTNTSSSNNNNNNNNNNSTNNNSTNTSPSLSNTSSVNNSPLTTVKNMEKNESKISYSDILKATSTVEKKMIPVVMKKDEQPVEIIEKKDEPAEKKDDFIEKNNKSEKSKAKFEKKKSNDEWVVVGEKEKTQKMEKLQRKLEQTQNQLARLEKIKTTSD